MVHHEVSGSFNNVLMIINLKYHNKGVNEADEELTGKTEKLSRGMDGEN